jgi:hypothetical protein
MKNTRKPTTDEFLALRALHLAHVDYIHAHPDNWNADEKEIGELFLALATAYGVEIPNLHFFQVES